MRKIKVKMIKGFLRATNVTMTKGSARRAKKLYNRIPRPYRHRDLFVGKLIDIINLEC